MDLAPLNIQASGPLILRETEGGKLSVAFGQGGDLVLEEAVVRFRSDGATSFSDIGGDPLLNTSLSALFDAKANLEGATFTGKVNAVAPSTGSAGINVGYGTAPNAGNRVNGDLWTTNLGIFVQYNGGTQQLSPVGHVHNYEPIITAGTTAQYYRGDKSWQTLNKAAVGLGNVDNTADSTKNVLTATKLFTARTINGVAFDGSANITINAVDSTARIAATEKGAANGVATLGVDGKIPVGQLPGILDDVQEYANLAAFPVTGTAGVLYVAMDTKYTYVWSGSAYAQTGGGSGGGPANTDGLAEGSVNKYYTDVRVRACALAGNFIVGGAGNEYQANLQFTHASNYNLMWGAAGANGVIYMTATGAVYRNDAKHLFRNGNGSADWAEFTSSRAWFAGNVVAHGGNIVARGSAASEGGQLVLGYGGGVATGISGQGNNTWNLDVDSANNVRFFRQGSDGSTKHGYSIAEATGLVTFPNGISVTGNATVTNSITAGGTIKSGNFAADAPSGNAYRSFYFFTAGAYAADIGLGANDLDLGYNCSGLHIFRIGGADKFYVGDTQAAFKLATLYVNTDKLLLQHDGSNAYVRSQIGALSLGAGGTNYWTLQADGNIVQGGFSYRLQNAGNGTAHGFVELNSGNATNSGYISFWAGGGTRVGYLGYADATYLKLIPEGGRKLDLAGAGTEISSGFVEVKTTGTPALHLTKTGVSNTYIFDDGNTHIRSTTATWFDSPNFNWGPAAGGGGWMTLGLNNGVPNLVLSGWADLKDSASGTTGALRLRSSSASANVYMQITNAAASAQWGYFTWTSTGGCTWSGAFTATTVTGTSDRRKKKRIKTVKGALDKVCQMRGVTFEWRKTNVKSAGVIAQEHREVVPEAVHEDEDGLLSVNNAATTAYLIEAIKELKGIVDHQARRIAELEAR